VKHAACLLGFRLTAGQFTTNPAACSGRDRSGKLSTGTLGVARVSAVPKSLYRVFSSAATVAGVRVDQAFGDLLWDVQRVQVVEDGRTEPLAEKVAVIRSHSAHVFLAR